MASKFHLQIVTPDKTFFDDEVEGIVVRTVEGDTGILKDHIPMVTPLSIGRIQMNKDGETLFATIAGGFIEVDEDKTVIITDAAEWPEEIDVDRAAAAKERAEARLKSGRGVDIVRAEIALRKAINRLELADNKK